MDTGQQLLTNWETPPLISAKLKISLVSWIISTDNPLMEHLPGVAPTDKGSI